MSNGGRLGLFLGMILLQGFVVAALITMFGERSAKEESVQDPFVQGLPGEVTKGVKGKSSLKVGSGQHMAVIFRYLAALLWLVRHLNFDH